MNLLVLAGLILALILNSIFVIDEKEDGIVFQLIRNQCISRDLRISRLPTTGTLFSA